ncbi:hypothetical protein RRG08_017363 [Elysia crispata]|uniref:Uncharacterized protein n=1 Tax=Elysia crispata TaxID=231223 RepID=A0AAE1E0E8_9GAST|nr:hypothetical protein RRG08_017363 [Elysia crispata]
MLHRKHGACWRIFEFQLHERRPSVAQLAALLQKGQRLSFNEQNAFERAVNEPPPTTLAAFFKLCEGDHSASNLLYPDVPRFYTCGSLRKTWNRGKQGKKVEEEDLYETHLIGRVSRRFTRKSWIIHTDHNKVSQILYGSYIHTQPKPVVSLITCSFIGSAFCGRATSNKKLCILILSAPPPSPVAVQW